MIVTSDLLPAKELSDAEAHAIAQAHLDQTETSKFDCSTTWKWYDEAESGAYEFRCSPRRANGRASREHARLVRVHKLTRGIRVWWIM